MKQEDIVQAFTKLHTVLESYDKDSLGGEIRRAEINNPWFNENNFLKAFNGILSLISKPQLERYAAKYEALDVKTKKIGLILAGNIPGVGFHDVLIGLLAGCDLKIKLSSEDQVMIPFIIKELKSIEPLLANRCEFVERISLEELDGVIATGSDNTARYFEQYFSKIPSLIRKSRTSVAVYRGNESSQELDNLCADITTYFGLGCRNVSKLLVLANADIIPLLEKLEHLPGLNNFSKYDNNYLYYKSIYLVNREPFLDTETVLIKETELLTSPISVLYYQRFDDESSIKEYISAHAEKIQCAVGNKEEIGFGEAQSPTILDYADGVDVRLFIDKL